MAERLPDLIHQPQFFPGRTKPCCVSLSWAVRLGYVKRGYFWCKAEPPTWTPWRFNLEGPGWCEQQPIHFCPYCGQDLDARE